MYKIEIKKIAALVVLATAFMACNGKKQQAPQQAQGAQKYNVVQVLPKSVSIYTDLPATLQGQEVIEIRPKVEGYLEEVFVDEGAAVRKGQKLFRISSPQYEQELRSAEAGINTAQADVDAAQMTVNKTRPLVEKEIISEYELQSAEYTLKSKKAALAQAKATLANARANVGYTLITAPANGVIGTLPYKKGSLVSSTSASPLTSLSADGNVYAYFSMNEKQLLDFNREFKGGTLQQKLLSLPEVQLVLADGSLYNHAGKIETASGLISTETGSVNFRAIYPNTEFLLQSGGSASVRLPHNIKEALVIPQSATYELLNKRMIYVLGADNKVASKAITVTPTNDGQYFVVTGGLTSGESVVLNGLTSLKDGAEIQPQQANPKDVYANLKAKE